MILLTELEPIGRTTKTHGLRGELSAELDTDCDVEALQHMVMRIDGIFVPFRIESLRLRGSAGALVQFAGVDSAEEAALYVGLDLYALRRELPATGDEGAEEEGLYAEDLENFTITRPDGTPLGTIDAVDTTTMNTLLHVALPDGRSAMIPLAEDWICDIDAEARTIAMDVPESLLSL